MLFLLCLTKRAVYASIYSHNNLFFTFMAYKIAMFPKIQVDTAIAYFLLTTFGEEKYPGIGHVTPEFWAELPEGRSADELERENYILIDLGLSRFDHHRLGQENKTVTSSLLVAKELVIEDRPDLQRLLELARRDDLEGKGTLSTDPIDRAFGLSGMLTNLNKSLPNDSLSVLNVVLPLLTAHFMEEHRRFELLPKEYQALVDSGKSYQFNAMQLGHNLKVVVIETDNTALPGYLRSRKVGAHLVVQKSSTGHINLISNQNARLKLNKLASLIKTFEAEKNNIVLNIDSSAELEVPGRTEGLAHWYYDARANTIQNGGVNPKGIPPTLITLDEMKDLVKNGLNIERQVSKFNNQGNFKRGHGGVVYLD